MFGLLTGYGLDYNILEAYRFIVETYEDGDQIYLFGFSRGAYTIRVLAGFVNLVGLLSPEQSNLCGYALTAYKQDSDQDDFKIAWWFHRILQTRHVPIRFMGCWDTVGSVIIPRRDRFYIPSLKKLPYTLTNPSVQSFRHAMAIDEKRRMFRLASWTEPQNTSQTRLSKPKLRRVRTSSRSGLPASIPTLAAAIPKRKAVPRKSC